MQAITTKYFGPSNVKGSRLKATASAGSLTLHYDDSLNHDENHRAAAMAFAAKLKWSGRWVGGFTKDGEGVFVCDDERFSLVFVADPYKTNKETS